MIYVSQPKGVGFSYCEDGPETCANDDLTAAQDAYDFFVAFFEAYPEFQKNEFFLTAESCKSQLRDQLFFLSFLFFFCCACATTTRHAQKSVDQGSNTVFMA